MENHLILIGTNQQIDRSITLNTIMNKARGLCIINWLGYKRIVAVFKPENFCNTADVVIVYVNNRQFDFTAYYLFHTSSFHQKNRKIRFVFLCSKHPFEVLSTITKRFKVRHVLESGGLANRPFKSLLLIRTDNKINALLEMINRVNNSHVFERSEKSMLCNFFKKGILEHNYKRLQYIGYAKKNS